MTGASALGRRENSFTSCPTTQTTPGSRRRPGLAKLSTTPCFRLTSGTVSFSRPLSASQLRTDTSWLRGMSRP
eukprot:1126364-Alexandrium_andersonii.AAC.1